MTTIKISKECRDLLVNAKKHPRETYEDVIMRLLRNDKSN
jgi:predicted CopG family antitoxin